MEPNLNFATIGTIQQAITLMFASALPIFLQTARTMLYAFATYRLVWRGIEWASSEQSFHHELFVTIKMILFLSLVFALLTFYNVPEPHFGMSFTHLITDSTQWIANVLDAAALENTFNNLGSLLNVFQMPGVEALLPIGLYLGLIGVIFAAKAAALFPIVLGLFGQAVAVLLGPLVVPFLVIPQFDWIFKTWMRGFIMLSMIQVVAFASLFVFQRFVFSLATGLPPGITVSQYPLYLMECCVAVFTCAMLPLSTPWLTSVLFGSHAGGGTSGRLISMVMRKR